MFLYSNILPFISKDVIELYKTPFQRKKIYIYFHQTHTARKTLTLIPPIASYLILVCPPKSHTWNLKFLYVTCSTLKPMVGIVVTTSPTCNRYRIVVFPAPSNPRMRMRISREPIRLRK